MSVTVLTLALVGLVPLGIAGGCLLASLLHHTALNEGVPAQAHIYHFRPGRCRWREEAQATHQ